MFDRRNSIRWVLLRSLERSSSPTEEFTLVVPISSLIRSGKLRYVCSSAGLDIIATLCLIGGTAFLHPSDRRAITEVGSSRSRRQSGPTEKFTSGGSYPMLNSTVSVRPSVRDPDWVLIGRNLILTAI